MANKNFFDQDKGVFVKVLDDKGKVVREFIGSKYFSPFAFVPKLERLDRKTIKVSLAKGTRADRISESILNLKVVKFLTEVAVNFNGEVKESLSIFREIENLKNIFINFPEIISFLNALKNKLEGESVFPIHGDLQKQNIFLCKGRLVLIDFEHFTFAPIELELVNSLFYDDENCLDAKKIILSLAKGGVIRKDLLDKMLIFYSIKQLSFGMGKKKVSFLLKKGMKKLNEIFDQKTATTVPNFSRKRSSVWTETSCLA